MIRFAAAEDTAAGGAVERHGVLRGAGAKAFTEDRDDGAGLALSWRDEGDRDRARQISGVNALDRQDVADRVVDVNRGVAVPIGDRHETAQRVVDVLDGRWMSRGRRGRGEEQRASEGQKDADDLAERPAAARTIRHWPAL
jgi:hypothetical protein